MVGGSFKVGGRIKPSYPNWQRKRTQNPSSVGSNPTEGTKNQQVRGHFWQYWTVRRGVIVRRTYALCPNLHPQPSITTRQAAALRAALSRPLATRVRSSDSKCEYKSR